MGIVPIIRDALGPLNNSHGLANRLHSAFLFNSAGLPVDLVNPKRAITAFNYAFDGPGANGPSLKASVNTGYVKLSPTVPVANSSWTVSGMTRFPIDSNAFAIFAASRTANVYHVIRNNATDALCSFNGTATNFSPTIAPLTLSGWKRLTVVGNAAGARAYLDGIFVGSHALATNVPVEDLLGDHSGNNTVRAWGASKDFFVWNRSLSSDEVLTHALDPFAMFADDDSWLTWFLFSSALSASLNALTSLQVKLKAGGSFAVGISGKASEQIAAKASGAFSTSVSGRATIQQTEKASLSAAAFLAGFTSAKTFAKLAQGSQTISLFGKTLIAATARAGVSLSGSFAALVGLAGFRVSGRAQPSLTVSISGAAKTKSSVVAGATFGIALSAKTAASVHAKLSGAFATTIRARIAIAISLRAVINTLTLGLTYSLARTYVVTPETRVLSIAPQDRNLAFGAQDRTLHVTGEARSYAIAAQDRTLVIKPENRGL